MFDAPRAFRFILFAPLVYCTTGYLQARAKFCLLYGAFGVFSMTGLRQLTKVNRPDWIKRDRIKALRLVLSAVWISSLITMVYYVI